MPVMWTFGTDGDMPDVVGDAAAISWKLILAEDREEKGIGRLVSAMACERR